LSVNISDILYDDVLNWPLSWNLMVNYVFFNELSFRVCISNMNLV
jgi:hypothetical protein